VDRWVWWGAFVATALVAYAAMFGTRLLVERVAARWSERSRLLASAATAILLGVLVGIGLRLPLFVLFPLFGALLGFYLGLLLAGTGWQHHLGTRVVFWGVVIAVAAMLRAFA
jgi:hypothetical protein